MFRAQDGWVAEYEKRGALWIHSGNPLQPHAKLSAGDHSIGFFNSDLVMEDSLLLDEACSDLLELLVAQGVAIEEIDRVMGPAMGAITLAHDLTRLIASACKRKTRCICSYTEKTQTITTTLRGTKMTVERSETSMFFQRGTPMRPNEHILPIEDVLTTGASVESTVAAIRAVGGVPLPFVVAIVNRSGLATVGGMKIVALIDRHMPKWAPAECPLCAQGSEAIPAKGENWARLTAAY